MSSFRRWYFYVVAAISLQTVTWAVIALVRNLLAPMLQLADPTLSADAERIAFQISVTVIGLPMFLIHWRWAGRSSVAGAVGEEDQTERFLYLYFMIGAFLIPLLANANSFFQSLLRLASGTPTSKLFLDGTLPDGANLAYTGIAVAILALMILYHSRLLKRDREMQTPKFVSAALHRLFIYIFSAVGLGMTSFAAASLLQWLLLTFGEGADLAVSRQLIDGMAEIIVGLPLWLFFWSRAQRLFRSGAATEQSSLLRKLYLYVVIFLSVVASVSAATALLAGFFRRLLGLYPQDGSGLVLSALVTGAVVWAYHSFVLREDTRRAPERGEQAGLRRLYWYLIAGVGLLVLLIGLGGLLGVLLEPGDYVLSRQREQVAWYAAMLLSGLAVWIVPWRQIQIETAEPMPAGQSARTSIVRRFYLFFFLLLATLTFLIAAIYVLSRLLLAVLGEPLSTGDLRTLGLAFAYAIMAIVVWLYHGRLLQQDREMLEAQQQRRASELRIVVVDNGDGQLGRRLLESLQSAVPGCTLIPVGLTGSAAAAMNAASEASNVEKLIAGADIIVGPWSMATSHAGLTKDNSLQAAIASSPARKLILPRPAPGWEWVVREKWRSETAVREATDIIEAIVRGGAPTAGTPSGPAMVIFLIAATVLILILIASLLGTVIPVF